MNGDPVTPDSGTNLCSREASRQAHDIISQTLIPALGSRPAVEMSVECPLHRSRSMYSDQEANKRRVTQTSNVYECGYCSKQFRTEFYMDRHMDNKHRDRLATNDENICLGDLCRILGCGDYDRKAMCAANRRGCHTCHPDEMARRRHECQLVFDRCFTEDQAHSVAHRQAVTRLKDHFTEQFCNHLNCDEHGRALPAPSQTSYRGDPRNPTPIAGHPGEAGSAKMRMIIALVVGIAVFYLILALSSNATRDDLRPRRKARKTQGNTGKGSPQKGGGPVVSHDPSLRRRRRSNESVERVYI